jgi:hypothetical protein
MNERRHGPLTMYFLNALSIFGIFISGVNGIPWTQEKVNSKCVTVMSPVTKLLYISGYH